MPDNLNNELFFQSARKQTDEAASSRPVIFGVEIPEPTPEDLKWQKRFDTLFEKAKSSIRVERKALKFLRDAIKEGHIWRTYYALDKNNGFDPKTTRNLNISRRDLRPSSNSYEYVGNLTGDPAVDPNIRKLLVAEGSTLKFYDHRVRSFIKKNVDKPLLEHWASFDLNNRKDSMLIAMALIGTLKDFKHYHEMGATCSYTSLLEAIENQDLEFVKFILENGGNPTENNKYVLCRAKELGKDDLHTALLKAIEELESKEQLPNKTNAAQDQREWSVMSPTLVEVSSAKSKFGIYSIYHIEFATDTITTMALRDGKLTVSGQCKFEDLTSLSIVEEAAAQLEKLGHPKPNLDRFAKDKPPALKVAKPNVVSVAKPVKGAAP